MLKPIVAGLALTALAATLLGPAAPRAAALPSPSLPAVHSGAGQPVGYWHRRWHRRHHRHGGLTIRL